MGSVNIMGNTKTLDIIRGKDKIKYVSFHCCSPLVLTGSLSRSTMILYNVVGADTRVYIAAVEFDQDDKPAKMGTSKRSFCTECSAMLWNYHDEYPDVSLREPHIWQARMFT
jgi:hypothetical protein